MKVMRGAITTESGTVMSPQEVHELADELAKNDFEWVATTEFSLGPQDPPSRLRLFFRFFMLRSLRGKKRP